jgi:anti-anti-sigma factor
MRMEIVIEKVDKDTNNIEVKGHLDTITAPELQSPLLKSVEENKKTVLDLGELEYISSAGLRVLLMAEKSSKAAKTTLIIKNISAEIREIFDMTGFSKIFTVE